MTDFATARHNMVESQIRTNKVTDAAIIDAFEMVPRELFVPKNLMGVAYVDEDLNIGNGRVLMEPMVFARLLQIALPDAGDEVLDLACGCGYSTAILSRLTGTVYGIEQDEQLVSGANERLGSLDVDNAAVIAGDPLSGYPKKAPYSLIVIGGGVERIPDTITDQLADGGRLITILYENGARQGTAVLVEKFGATVSKRVVFDASVPLLPEFRKEPKFVF
ncbi:protein-L-isoaspartate O-methyltransferase [Nisaea sp.]|uniref:protein-L-isoaspartate O-methyltransferase family protein n=1 Tax=Nisaea sp. TaxID=2024842 RepID=UPI0032EE943C